MALWSQLNGELAGQAQVPDRGSGVSKVLQEAGLWRSQGATTVRHHTKCGVWQGVASAVGWVGTQHRMPLGIQRPLGPCLEQGPHWMFFFNIKRYIFLFK